MVFFSTQPNLNFARRVADSIIRNPVKKRPIGPFEAGSFVQTKKPI
jgi:hypothetical protein